MSVTFLTVVSVIEAVLLVVTLAFYLITVGKDLRKIVDTLAEVAWGARAVERQLRASGSNVKNVNAALEDIAGALPGLNRKIEGTIGVGAR